MNEPLSSYEIYLLRLAKSYDPAPLIWNHYDHPEIKTLLNLYYLETISFNEMEKTVKVKLTKSGRALLNLMDE